MDTAKLRELVALEPTDFAYHADAIRRNAAEAADTIERLQKQNNALKDSFSDNQRLLADHAREAEAERLRAGDELVHQLAERTKERDAALAKIKLLEAALADYAFPAQAKL